MELWDVYDSLGNKTGKIIERDSANVSICRGEYFMAVHIYIRNSNGEFLIQKRSIKKKNMPGVWDITGGAVIAGENSIEGAIREVREELGIILALEKFKLISRFRCPNCLVDIWDVVKDIDLSTCNLQEDEVDEVKFVQREELFDLLRNGPYYDDDYNNVIFKFYDKQF